MVSYLFMCQSCIKTIWFLFCQLILYFRAHKNGFAWGVVELDSKGLRRCSSCTVLVP